MKIRNPILQGFNPDPSIVRVEDDHCIATSTFEWFPGVQIHHSRDLAHWRIATRPLTRESAPSDRDAPTYSLARHALVIVLRPQALEERDGVEKRRDALHRPVRH